MDRARTMLPLFARMLTGAAIGIAIVILYFTIDYLGSSEKRLYFIDREDAFITVLALGIVIGTIIGIGWAISSKAPSK